MRLLIVGAGGVGDAAGRIAAKSSHFESICLADIDPVRAARSAAATGDPEKVISARVDASDTDNVTQLAESLRADAVLNACDPRFVMPIFRGAAKAGAHYIDMAMSLSRPHPTDPFHKTGVILGEDQFNEEWRYLDAGRIALVGMGVEPGLSDVFARYASDKLFSEVEEFGIRDGSNLQVQGFTFAPTFSIWTTVEECLNPPLIYERDRGFYTTEPFSEPEIFKFPEGIGPIECVNVEHEEVVLIPRWLEADRVTFKYGLGEEFISILKAIHKLGLDSTLPIDFRGTKVSPRDFLASLLPDPITLGDKMTGKTCAGTWVKGLDKEGNRKAVYLYHVVDNEETMAKWGTQAVVWQTAINPIVAIELLATGAWSGVGVLGPEALPAEPFLEMLGAHNSRWGIVNM